MTTSDVGRNDPCPCGSGKKFKNCCLAKANVEAPSPRELVQQVHDKLLMELLKLAKSSLGRGQQGNKVAWDEFWPDHPSDDFRDHDRYHPLFLPWLFYLYKPQDMDDPDNLLSPHTVGARFRRKRRHN